MFGQWPLCAHCRSKGLGFVQCTWVADGLWKTKFLFCGLANGLNMPTKRRGSCCGKRSSGLAYGLLPTLRSEGLVERAEHKIWQIACLLFLFCRGLRSWVIRSSACSFNARLKSARSVRPCGFVGSLANYRRLLFLRFLLFFCCFCCFCCFLLLGQWPNAHLKGKGLVFVQSTEKGQWPM